MGYECLDKFKRFISYITHSMGFSSVFILLCASDKWSQNTFVLVDQSTIAEPIKETVKQYFTELVCKGITPPSPLCLVEPAWLWYSHYFPEVRNRKEPESSLTLSPFTHHFLNVVYDCLPNLLWKAMMTSNLVQGLDLDNLNEPDQLLHLDPIWHVAFGLSQIDLDDTLMVELVSFNERLPIKAAERRRRPIKHQITVFPL